MGHPRPPVVEVVVEYGVRNIEKIVLDVRRMKGGKDLGAAK